MPPHHIALQQICPLFNLHSEAEKANRSHGTIEPFDTNLFWSNKHETP